jgi:hypothetical protein
MEPNVRLKMIGNIEELQCTFCKRWKPVTEYQKRTFTELCCSECGDTHDVEDTVDGVCPSCSAPFEHGAGDTYEVEEYYCSSCCSSFIV